MGDARTPTGNIFRGPARRAPGGGWPPQDGEFTELFRPEMFTSGQLTLDDRKMLVEQAILLLDQVYVNRTIKAALHGVDPILRLRTLRQQLDELEPKDLTETVPFGLAWDTFEGPRAPEVDFHRAMTNIFTSLRDRHTHYYLPKPFKDLVAFLPFDVETVVDEQGIERYIVARVRDDELVRKSVLSWRWPSGTGEAPWTPPPWLELGWQVVMWNNLPIEHATRQLAAEHAGSNPAAQIAQGLERLTLRPLIVAPIPDAPIASVGLMADGAVGVLSDNPWQMVEIDFEWLVMSAGTFQQCDDEAASRRAAEDGMDPEHELACRFRHQVYLGGAGSVPGDKAGSAESAAVHPLNAGSFARQLSARAIDTSHGRFGYIRIHSFSNPKRRKGFAGRFVEQFARFLTDDEMPQNGVIIDLRGNGGGIIPAAESTLQLLTPRRIEPEPFQFLISPLIHKLTAHADGSRRSPDLSPWKESVDLGIKTGTTFSRGVPITRPEQCNGRGQVYYGPSVLIIDANCYSAADMFIAGYRDHRIGPVVGTDANTGAGGANVWTHSLLGRVLRTTRGDEGFPELDYEAEPDLTVSIRRSLRVGANAGMQLEDLGVIPDYHYRFSAIDVLERNRNLIEAVSELLVRHEIDPPPPAPRSESSRNLERLWHGKTPYWPEPKPRRLALEVTQAGPRAIRGTVSSAGADRLDVYVDGRPETTLDVEESGAEIELEVPRRSSAKAVLELEGYARGKLVTARRRPLEAG